MQFELLGLLSRSYLVLVILLQDNVTSSLLNADVSLLIRLLEVETRQVRLLLKLWCLMLHIVLLCVGLVNVLELFLVHLHDLGVSSRELGLTHERPTLILSEHLLCEERILHLNVLLQLFAMHDRLLFEVSRRRHTTTSRRHSSRLEDVLKRTLLPELARVPSISLEAQLSARRTRVLVSYGWNFQGLRVQLDTGSLGEATLYVVLVFTESGTRLNVNHRLVCFDSISVDSSLVP